MRVWWKKSFYIAVALVALWLGSRYLLPVLLPFLLGALVALAAEPVVNLGVKRLHLQRGVASVVAVVLTLTAWVALVSLIAAAGQSAAGMAGFCSGKCAGAGASFCAAYGVVLFQ